MCLKDLREQITWRYQPNSPVNMVNIIHAFTLNAVTQLKIQISLQKGSRNLKFRITRNKFTPNVH